LHDIEHEPGVGARWAASASFPFVTQTLDLRTPKARAAGDSWSDTCGIVLVLTSDEVPGFCANTSRRIPRLLNQRQANSDD
jgi:hypothetical protein